MRFWRFGIARMSNNFRFVIIYSISRFHRVSNPLFSTQSRSTRFAKRAGFRNVFPEKSWKKMAQNKNIFSKSQFSNKNVRNLEIYNCLEVLRLTIFLEVLRFTIFLWNFEIYNFFFEILRFPFFFIFEIFRFTNFF